MTNPTETFWGFIGFGVMVVLVCAGYALLAWALNKSFGHSSINVEPGALVSRITQAHLKGKTMWGFHGPKLKFISDQIQKITNDMLYNMGPKIYYFKR